MLAAGIVQDTFAREGEAVEGEGGKGETTGGYFYCYFYWYILPLRLESLPFFLALEFKSQNIHAKQTYIYIYISRVSINMTK